MATSKKVIIDNGNAQSITNNQFNTWSTGLGDAKPTSLNSGSYNPPSGGSVINVQSETDPEQIIDPNTTNNSPQSSLPVSASQSESTVTLLSNSELEKIYPQTQTNEIGATFQPVFISDAARTIMSDPSAIAEQQAQDAFIAENPTPTVTEVSVPLTEAEAEALLNPPVTQFTGTAIPDNLANETIYYSNGIVEKVQYFGTTGDTIEDPYETARLEAEARANELPEEYSLETIRDQDPYEAARIEAGERFDSGVKEYDLEVIRDEDPYEAARIEAGERFDSGVKEYDIEVLRDQDPYEAFRLENEARLDNQAREFDAESADGSNREGAIFNSQQQQAISTQSGANQNTDWRVRLRLAPAADYLYNANQPGILAPLATRGGTDGVIFPYTPKIDTGYRAQYNNVDLTHSNYRGYFYQNSYVDAINITGHFTAQNTTDARYLLAVIHFFRSVTKMFYGNDPQRGSPPPLVFLSGYGTYQFNDHPCVVTSFAYNLPDDVDYIKADVANQQGQNTNSRSPKSSGDPQFTPSAGRRLTSNLSAGALPPQQFGTDGEVNLATGAPTMVPTKMDIQISLLPIVSRTNVSKNFSLAKYASGSGLKGGFW